MIHCGDYRWGCYPRPVKKNLFYQNLAGGAIGVADDVQPLGGFIALAAVQVVVTDDGGGGGVALDGVDACCYFGGECLLLAVGSAGGGSYERAEVVGAAGASG